MSARCAAFTAVLAGSLLAAESGEVLVREGVRAELDVKVSMRDGVKLSTNVYRPAEGGPFPVVLMRTPYGNGGADLGPSRPYAGRGYALIVQDCRGRFESEGEWDPFLSETPDGQDTLAWILSQPWCSGSIAMAGGSYVGFTQWLAAIDAPPGLKCIAPVVSPADFYGDCAYTGGAFRLSLAGVWGAMMSAPKGAQPLSVNWPEVLKTQPLSGFPKAVGWPVPYFEKWVSTPERTGFWLKAAARGNYGRIRAATLGVGGWFDIFADALFENWNGMRARGEGHRAIMGPWAHGVNQRKVGALDFGPAAQIELEALQLEEFEHRLEGKERPSRPPLRIFVMGRNDWRDEEAWPLARAAATRFYLHSDGAAGTRGGALTREPPSAEPEDSFTYDPADPVPTTGGANLFPLFGIGPLDQTEVEKRPDVLVYTTAPLQADLEVTGPVVAVIFASSSGRDTDFTAKLVDVHPDGKAYNLCDGILRARFREGPIGPTLIEPDSVHRYEIHVGVTSNVFLAGHAIRLEVSSSNFPRFARNCNSGAAIAGEGTPVAARQKVFHDGSRASHLILPVVP